MGPPFPGRSHLSLVLPSRCMLTLLIPGTGAEELQHYPRCEKLTQKRETFPNHEPGGRNWTSQNIFRNCVHKVLPQESLPLRTKVVLPKPPLPTLQESSNQSRSLPAELYCRRQTCPPSRLNLTSISSYLQAFKMQVPGPPL